MKNKVYIDVHASRTKVAVTENGEMVELYVERETFEKLVGNIYKGRVENVLPGMQAAFVNIGLDKNAFLYVHENMVDSTELLEGTRYQTSINDKVGDVIMVQVVKEQFGTKGVRVTKDISLAGRYLVLTPTNDFVGVSKKITDEKVRQKLFDAVMSVKADGVGYIIRTNAKDVTISEIKKEAKKLFADYKKLLVDYEKSDCCKVVHRESDLIERTMRDVISKETESVIVNNKDVFNRLQEKFEYLMPQKIDVLSYHDQNGDMFEKYGLDKAVENMLKRKVPLRNGGYLIIDRAEAFTVIDVNTGKYVGENNHEETVFLTNLIAVDEIAKQLRLRNLGGIIIVDFIDMDDIAHREQVLEKLREALKKDRVKTMLVGMTGLGLVEITRKKTISLVDKMFLQSCPYCKGDSFVHSEEYVIMRLRASLYSHFEQNDDEAILIRVCPSVFAKLFVLRTLEQDCQTVWADKRIYVVPDDGIHIEKYEIKSCNQGVLDLPNTARMLY